MGLIRTLSPLALVALSLSDTVLAGSPAVCPLGSSAPLSCQSTSSNTCCTEVQGQVLQVQFWDTKPATGPEDHWTIHGLWPDYCDGSYTSTCDKNRQYTNISCILESAGRDDLLDLMQTYWKDQSGGDESFWEHEWGKHGTCYSTLNPSCYTDYTAQEEVVDFFQQTVDLFQSLPTYDYLASAGIYPSSTQNYTETEILAALRAGHGAAASLSCDGHELYQVEYTFNVRGSVANGVFVPVEPVGEGDGCPAEIMYLPKDMSSVPKVKGAATC
ncbi:hypothetical protein AAFC00_004769 [Neodothiora populina]|uniref:ribonuclease T2 n=1 Tax=Neodothiora populina TaxID=2781224 RepID=A0ABR3P3F8_9PEZI